MCMKYLSGERQEKKRKKKGDQGSCNRVKETRTQITDLPYSVASDVQQC